MYIVIVLIKQIKRWFTGLAQCYMQVHTVHKTYLPVYKATYYVTCSIIFYPTIQMITISPYLHVYIKVILVFGYICSTFYMLLVCPCVCS